MFVELHILQNFAPSNLNRDDTNAPKDCEFGGYRRARISSQCLKRAMRTSFKEDGLLQPGDLAVRTKRLLKELTDQMVGAEKPAEEARQVAEAALASVGLGLAKEDKTQYLVFLGNREIAGLARACLDHWDELLGASPAAPVEGQTAKQAKKGKKAAVPKPVSDALLAVLDGGRAADLALFGRMLADLPDKNVDGASQVAHAISTNKVETEFDFYTAVDDLKPDDTAGADMLGTVEFNSACFYRYVNLDTGQLLDNLNGDAPLAAQTLEAFVRASVEAIPTGKQNSMAAHNQPSLVFAVVRERGLRNLSNAFVRPVVPNGEGDLIENSARRLAHHFGELRDMYGDAGLRGAWVVAPASHATESLGAEKVNLDGLVAGVVSTVQYDRAVA